MVRNWQKTNNTGTWGGDWNVYTYDALNRLVREKEMDTGLTITYGYDSLGNKTLEQDNRDNLRYTYNELNQLITKEAYNRTTNYSYDNRGNRILETSVNTQENRRTYEWDETNRLVKGTRGPDYGLYTSEYTYNALGQRVNSTIMGPDKTKYDRDYTIDYTSPDYHDIAEYNTGHYQWQGTKRVHDLTYLYTADGQRLQVDATRYNQWSPEAVTYKLNVHEDIMGSGSWYTRQESGYNANHHDYTTWGNNTKAPTYNYDPEYRATEPYYTGHPYDGSLNIYYAKNRFYDAETGSWLSPDPAKDGLNWYQYCGSNPVTYVDPLGLFRTAGAADALEGRVGYFVSLNGSRELLKMDGEGYQFINWLKNTEIGDIFNRSNSNYVYDDHGKLIGIDIQNVEDGYITIGYGHTIKTEADARKYGFQIWGKKSPAEIDAEKSRHIAYYNSLGINNPAILSLMEADTLLKNDLEEFRKLAEGLRESGKSYSANQMDGLTSNVYNTGTAHHNDPDSFQYYLIKNDAVGAINILHDADAKQVYGNHTGLLRRRLMEYNIYFNNDYTYYENTEMDELKKVTCY